MGLKLYKTVIMRNGGEDIILPYVHFDDKKELLDLIKENAESCSDLSRIEVFESKLINHRLEDTPLWSFKSAREVELMKHLVLSDEQEKALDKFFNAFDELEKAGIDIVLDLKAHDFYAYNNKDGYFSLYNGDWPDDSCPIDPDNLQFCGDDLVRCSESDKMYFAVPDK